MAFEIMGNDISNNKLSIGMTIPNAYWLTLWNYCCHIAPFVINTTQMQELGKYNSGLQLTQKQSWSLAGLLSQQIESGALYVDEFAFTNLMQQANGKICGICFGTGKHNNRRCQICYGNGVFVDMDIRNPFDSALVSAFVDFLYRTNGFKIITLEDTMKQQIQQEIQTIQQQTES